MIERGSAAGTVRSARKVLRLVLATAEEGGAIKSNPCNGVRVPRSPRTEMVFLNAEEVEALASVITPPFGTLIRLAAYTGMRAGELEALRVGRLELLKSRLLVAASVTEVHGHGMVFGPTKTYERRTIPLMPSIRDELGLCWPHDPRGPTPWCSPAPTAGRCVTANSTTVTSSRRCERPTFRRTCASMICANLRSDVYRARGPSQGHSGEARPLLHNGHP